MGLKSGLQDKSISAARRKNNNNKKKKNGNACNSQRRATDIKTAHSLPVPTPAQLPTRWSGEHVGPSSLPSYSPERGSPAPWGATGTPGQPERGWRTVGPHVPYAAPG